MCPTEKLRLGISRLAPGLCSAGFTQVTACKIVLQDVTQHPGVYITKICSLDVPQELLTSPYGLENVQPNVQLAFQPRPMFVMPAADGGQFGAGAVP